MISPLHSRDHNNIFLQVSVLGKFGPAFVSMVDEQAERASSKQESTGYLLHQPSLDFLRWR